MDRETLSQYGWVTICIIIIVILIALATPFGNYIYTQAENAVVSLGGKVKETFANANIDYNTPAFGESSSGGSTTPVTTNYTAEEIEADEHLFAIGATQPEYVVANVNTSNKSIVITKNGENSDGIIKEDPFETYDILIDDSFENLEDLKEALPPVAKAKTLRIQDGIVNIPSCAFLAFDLEKVYIPQSMEYMGSGSFESCEKLNAIYISDITAWCNIDFDDSLSNPLELGHNLYLNNQLIVNLTIPDNTEIIKSRAFIGCTSIKSLTMNNNVTSLGSQAFCQCSSLKTATLSDNIDKINGSTFYQCTDLETVNIPASATKIGGWAFFECSSLKSIVVPELVTVIDQYAFYRCSSLETVKINANNLTDIKDSAFSYCPMLNEINIPETVTTLGSTVNPVFLGSDNMTKCSLIYNPNVNYKWIKEYVTDIEFKDNVTDISKNNFGKTWSALKHVKMTDSVITIGDSAFYMCRNLESIIISNNATIIDNSAFFGCKSLTSIIIPNSVESIGNLAFSGCNSLTEITIPSSVNEISGTAFNSTTLSSMTVKCTEGSYADTWAQSKGCTVEYI